MKLGKTVVDGRLQYASPSAIKTFSDPQTGCPRQWAFRYVAGIRAPTTPAQQAGIDGHKRIEHFLKTREPILTDIDRPGAGWIQAGFKPEHFVVEPEIDLARPLYRLAGLPIVGRLDAANLTGIYINPEQEVVRDPDTPEIIDWKYSGDPRKWGKNATQIRDDLAMCAYATWLEQWVKPFKNIRLSHVYFSTKRIDAFKRTAKVSAARAAAVVRAHEPIVEQMKVVAGISDPNQAPCNLRACDAFGGCYYKNVCDRPLDDLVRETWGDQQEESVGLLDNMNMSDHIAELEKQERAEREARKPAPDVSGLLSEIEQYGLGLPTFEGDAAAAVLEAGGEVTGSGRLVGIPSVVSIEQILGLLAELKSKFPDGPPNLTPAPDHVVVEPPASASVAVPAPDVAPDVPSALPPESRLPTPAEAAKELPPEDVITLPKAVRDRVEASGTPAPAPAPATPAPAPAPATPATAPAPAESKGRGRPATTEGSVKKLTKPVIAKKLVHLMTALGIDDPDAVENYAIGTLTSLPEDTKRIADLEQKLAEYKAAGATWAKAATCSQAIELWVDCLPSDDLPAAIDDEIDAWCAEVAKVGKATHILAAPNDSPIAYGKWRGYLSACVRANPPQPGRYYMRVKGDEVRECIAEALRTVAMVHRGL
jgi:hypothetical protein